MTNDASIFQELHKSSESKVRIGNSELIKEKGKETVAITGFTS